jgi:nucleoside-diphosphate kinase
MNREEVEQTLILIKPDALKNSLTGYVLSQLSEFHSGLRFAAAKIVHVGKMLAEEHYAEHRGKIFYPSLLEYIMGLLHYPDEPWKRRVIALVYQGPDAVKKIRDICGPTNPHVAREKRPGCIRALGTVVLLKDSAGNEIGERMDNLIHASASADEAEREIKLWFKPSDFPPFMRAFPAEVNEDEYFYSKGGSLFKTHEPGSVCLIAPGEVVWQSDFEALRSLQQGLPASSTVGAVAAKYLINYAVEP